MKNKEVRYIVADSLEVRADDEPPVIEGYAAVFNEETVIGDWFREVIRPGAFKRAISEKQDVRALWNHDANYVLGRTKSGTLKLSEDKRGLKIQIDPPDTQSARDLVESIRRGDVDQMSFAFIASEEKWPKNSKADEDKLPLRELIDLDLYDVSPVTYPAYEATSVGVRSAEDIYNDHLQSLAGVDFGDDDDAGAAAMDRDRACAAAELIRLTTN